MPFKFKTELVLRLLVALLVGVLQAFYIVIDSDQILARDVGPLFHGEFLAGASCVILASLTLAIMLTGYPLPLRAIMFGLVIGCFTFELAYFVSRFPILSPVSLSALLRPWSRIMPFAIISSLIGSALFALNNYKANNHT